MWIGWRFLELSSAKGLSLESKEDWWENVVFFHKTETQSQSTNFNGTYLAKKKYIA